MSACVCPTWKANIDKIDAPLILAQIRNPKFLVDFVQFVYCPWCGEALRVTVTVPCDTFAMPYVA